MNLAEVYGRYPKLREFYADITGSRAPGSFSTLLHRIITDFHGPQRAGRQFGIGSGVRWDYDFDQIRAVATRLLVVQAFGRGSTSTYADLAAARWIGGFVIYEVPAHRTRCQLNPPFSLYVEITTQKGDTYGRTAEG